MSLAMQRQNTLRRFYANSIWHIIWWKSTVCDL